MKHIIKQLCYLAIFTSLTYLILLGTSYIFYPPLPQNLPMDTLNSKETIWSIDRRYVLFNPPDVQSESKKQLVFLGSSNVKEGFRPQDIEALLPEYTVHNIAFGGCSIVEMRELAEFIVDNSTENSLENTVFVLGLYYGCFPTSLPQTHSVFTNEKLRYRLYFNHNGTIQSSFSKIFSPMVSTLLRPFIFISNPVRILNLTITQTRTVYETFFRDSHFDLTPFQILFFPKSITPMVERNKVLEYFENLFRQQKNVIPNLYFEELLSTYHVLNKAGAPAIVVEVPLPLWHRRASNQYKAYQLQKKSYYDQLELLGVPILDFKDIMPDSLFLDTTHPLPQHAKKWSEFLINYLDKY